MKKKHLKKNNFETWPRLKDLQIGLMNTLLNWILLDLSAVCSDVYFGYTFLHNFKGEESKFCHTCNNSSKQPLLEREDV